MAFKKKLVGSFTVENQVDKWSGEELSLKRLTIFEAKAVHKVLITVSDLSEKEPQILRYARRCIGLTKSELGDIIDFSADDIDAIENGTTDISIQKTSGQLYQLALACLVKMKLDGHDCFNNVLVPYQDCPKALFIK